MSDSSKFVSGDGGETAKGGGGFSSNNVSEPSKNQDGGKFLSGVTRLALGSSDTLIEPRDLIPQDNTIPLSPQWLIAKSGDNKPPPLSMDPPRTPGSHAGNSDFAVKERWRGDGNRDPEKRRDWWRTNTESDNSRRDGWREEERESAPTMRRDRWKESGDGGNDNRRIERWPDNLTTARDATDGRRAPPSERWSESLSRDATADTVRRNSKWSTRWGPDDKEKEIRREKRPDNDKESEAGQHSVLGRERTTSVSINRGDNDREPDASARDRVWRPHSLASRNKAEGSLLGSTPPKYAPGFGVGRGRGENSSVGFAVGRGRASASAPRMVSGSRSSIGASSIADKYDISQRYRYPRAKLLDIYRSSSTVSCISKIPENFTEAPEVTQSEPVEPMAFIEPETDERDVLEGIGKGDIVGSGAVYGSKEKTRDLARVEKDDNCTEISKENKIFSEVEEDGTCKHVISDDLVRLSDVLQGRTEIEKKQTPVPVVSQREDLCPNEEKDNHQTPDIFAIADAKAEFLDKYIAKDASGHEKLQYEEKKEMVEKQYTSPPPEEISLFYIDPQGAIQGPFLGADIIGWFELGYFDTSLPVRIVDAPEDTPFCPLGEIMPQLRLKPQAPWEYQAADKHLDTDDAMIERNIAQSSSVDSNVLQGGNQQLFDDSLDNTSNLQLPNSQVHDNRRDVNADRVLDLQPTHSDINSENPVLERASSIRRRMSAFPDIEPETGELPKQSLFSQQWAAGSDILQAVTQASSGYSPRLQTPQSAFWQSGTHGLSSERHDTMQMEGSSLLHGLDDAKMRQLLQIEKLQAQKQLEQSGAPSPRSVQQPHSLLELLNQQKSSVTPSFEQLRNPSVSLDFNSNALQQLASAHPLHQIPSPHPLQQLASSHTLSRLQHPSNVHIPPSDVNMEELLRLHQQQQAPHPLLDQLLRQQMQFPSAEQMQVPNRVGNLLQDNSRLEQMHAYQLEQLHHRQQQDVLLELLQRQQEEKLRAHQQAAFLQQQQLKLDEQRVSGVWEVDEFGQFVRTQASIPMQASHEALHQQQLHLMQQKANLHPLHHSHPQHLPVDIPGLYAGDLSQMQLPKIDIRTLRDVHAEPDIAALLGGTSRIDADPLAFLQGQRSRFEGQAPLANPGMTPFEMDMLHKSQMFHPSNIDGTDVVGGRAHGGQSALPSPGMFPYEHELLQKNKAFHMSNIEANDTVAGRIRGGRPHDVELEAMHMYSMLGRDRNNQNYNLQIPLDHNVGPINGHTVEPLDFSESVLLQNNLVNAFRKQHHQHQQHGRGHTQAMSEDLLRLLAGNSSAEDSSVLNSVFSSNEQHQISSLTVNQQLDTLGYIANPSTQSAWDSSLTTNTHHDEAEHAKINVLGPMSSTIESSDKWTPAVPVAEDSSQLPSFDQASFEVDQTDVTINTNASVDNSSELPKSEDGSGQSNDAQVLGSDDSEFVETKKNKKRGSKVKPAKNFSVPTQDSSTALSSPGKSTETTCDTDENNSTNLSSPSVADFLPMREERSNPQPSPVWSVDPSKQLKVAKSLKEIQEAEKKARDEEERQQQSTGPQLQAPLQKPSTPIPITNTPSAWQKPLLSSQLTNKPTSNNIKSKTGGEEEMFWDYNDKGSNKQLVEENTMAKRLASLSAKNNENVPRQAAAGSPSLSGFSAAVARQPPVKVVNKHVEVPATVSQQASLSIGEAKAFRRWCEEQIKKFNGKGHMSLLEFCMGLPSASEVGDYLRIYLGEGPMVEAFKTEFLRRKEKIPAEIIRVIFPTSEAVVKDDFENSGSDKRSDASSKKNLDEDESEFEVVRSGKRKGKKGKKVVDPSLVLGFNVSSGNRIFMGEIQHIE